MDEKSCLEIYMMVRFVPGWLSYCAEAGYSKEEIENLEMLDDELGSYQPEKEANAWAKTVMKEGGPDIFFCATDEEKLSAIAAKLSGLYLELEEKIHTLPFHEVRHFKSRVIDPVENLRFKIRGRQVFSSPNSKGLPPWKIAQARQVPLENIILNLPKDNRIPCPFHRGRDRNFLVRGGFGYCFTCGEHSDSIKWCQIVEGKTFVEAVEYLVRSHV